MTDASYNLPQSIKPPASKWLRRVRAVWFGLIAILFVTFLVSIPAAYKMLVTVCETGDPQCTSWAQLTPKSFEILAQHNISLQSFAVFNLITFVAFSLFCWFAGLLVLRYRSHDWYGLLVSYLLITLAAGGPSFIFMISLDFTDLPAALVTVPGLTIFPMYLALSLFFQTFPDGRIYPRWARLGTVLILANYAAWIAPEPYNIQYWSSLGSALWLLLVYGFHIFIQGYRYRYFYTKDQRQQTKWLIFGGGIVLVTAISIAIFVDRDHGRLLEGLITTVGFYLPIAVAVAIAILRYQLWDIDIIINRTLVYGLLTAVLIGIYALVVSTLSLLIQDNGNFVVSLLGAGIIAILFQPLRTFVQRIINRWIFGRRDEPLTVMVELGKSLEMILSPDDALKYLVETTAQTLKLPYLAIQRDDNSMLVTFGKGVAEPEHFPLIHQAKTIGTLLVSPRSPGENLAASDKLLLENVARQVSNIIHASLLAHDLQQSRQQILTTREEERRRLRRDLHDGLGPALATLTLRAEAAREWLRRNPEKSEALLDEIITSSQSTLADIRRIVYALRPPALDDLGLLPAIKEQAKHYTNGGLLITVESPEKLPVLPAAVEVATYRIVQEALTNVTRHAKAHKCKVNLKINGKMDIEIIDDGIGIPVPHRTGVGLNSIHERAAELGGSCMITSKPGKGTQIKVSLPTS
ncbi:MAG: sensor histidine kinase [Anaerolineae bacterium]